MTSRVVVATIALLAAGLCPAARVGAQETFTPLVALNGSIATGEKPQSKLWFHDDRWWAVLASSSVTPSGTWVWRLGSDNRWTNVLRLSSSTSAKADAIALGGVTHVLLHQSSAQLISIQYDPVQHTYVPWPVNPNPTSINLSGSETATIDVDSTDRLWLSTETSSHVVVYYSDYPYTNFQGPISLDDHINGDDISVITALPFHDPPEIGVFWSNQNTERFGFRVHVDGANPLVWMPDEVPGAQSALHLGNGFADDHMNLKIGSDGTLYVAVKTSYDTGGVPHIGLLVRRPNGLWDDVYEVNRDGTRPLLLLNEPANLIRVVDEDTGTIRYRDSPISSIHFGSQKTLMSGSLNDPTSSKMNWTNQVVVMAYGKGVLIRRSGVGSTTTTTTVRGTTSTSTTTRPSTTTTPTTSTTTSSTTLPAGAVIVEFRIANANDDVEEDSAGKVNLTSSDLELVNDGGIQTVGLRFPGVAIPQGATILTAWVQFQVDETSNEATTVRIEGQAADDALAFTTGTGNVSQRPRTTTFATWSPVPWTAIDAHGADQRTPDLASVVQQIVSRSGWTSGRALALVITGSGHRVARAYDGVPAGAALLHVAYQPGGGTLGTTTTTTRPASTTTTTTLPTGVRLTFERRVAASLDDAEEDASGVMDLASSDLEMVQESTTQKVGMRFGNVTIPHNATILAAWVQFQVDEVTTSSTPATTLRIEGEASDDALPFASQTNNISLRSRTTSFSSWSPPLWPQVDVAGAAQRSSDLSGVIHEIVTRAGWSSGKAMALIVTGTGKRVAEAWDGVPGAAPLLHVEYTTP